MGYSAAIRMLAGSPRSAAFASVLWISAGHYAAASVRRRDRDIRHRVHRHLRATRHRQRRRERPQGADDLLAVERRPRALEVNPSSPMFGLVRDRARLEEGHMVGRHPRDELVLLDRPHCIAPGV